MRTGRVHQRGWLHQAARKVQGVVLRDSQQRTGIRHRPDDTECVPGRCQHLRKKTKRRENGRTHYQGKLSLLLRDGGTDQ